MTTPHALRRLGRALLLIGLAALPAAAQRGTPTKAPAPLPPPPLAYAPSAVVISDGAFDVTLLTHASANVSEGSRRMADYFRLCRDRFGVPAADSSAVARSMPWDWTTGGTADPGTLTILVGRATPNELDCRSTEGQRSYAYLRGYRVTADTAYPYAAALSGVSVVRDSQVVAPVDDERVTLTRITQRGLVTVPGAILRVSVPLDSIAPDSLGELHELSILVAAPDLPEPHRVRIPSWALRPIWRQALAARARVLSGDRSADEAAILLRPDPPGVSEPRRLEARVRVGTAFADAGDVAAARVLLAEAVASEPCLTLAPAASAPAGRIVSQMTRPRARCVADMRLAVGRALLVPGLGHFDTPRRRIASVATFLAVVGTLAASQSTNDEAKRLYAEYRAFDSTVPGEATATAGKLYRKAEDTRVFGSALVVTGATIWGASILESAWAERRQQRRLARVRDMDVRSPRVGIAPFGAPGRIGVTLTRPARETSR